MLSGPCKSVYVFTNRLVIRHSCIWTIPQTTDLKLLKSHQIQMATPEVTSQTDSCILSYTFLKCIHMYILKEKQMFI